MARRVETDRLQELVRLHRMGTSARQVVRLLRMGPNTERRYRRVLAKAGLLEARPDLDPLPSLESLRAAVNAGLPVPTPRARTPGCLDAWRTQIAALLAKGLGPRATFARLRDETRDSATPFRASYSAVKRAYRQLRREQGHSDGVVVLVKHLEQYPKDRAEAASRHVRRAGDLTYHAVKRVLTRALDVASVPRPQDPEERLSLGLEARPDFRGSLVRHGEH